MFLKCFIDSQDTTHTHTQTFNYKILDIEQNCIKSHTQLFYLFIFSCCYYPCYWITIWLVTAIFYVFHKFLIFFLNLNPSWWLIPQKTTCCLLTPPNFTSFFKERKVQKIWNSRIVNIFKIFNLFIITIIISSVRIVCIFFSPKIPIQRHVIMSNHHNFKYLSWTQLINLMVFWLLNEFWK